MTPEDRLLEHIYQMVIRSSSEFSRTVVVPTIESAVALHRQGDDSAATEVCKALLAAAPNNVDANILLAVIHERAEEHLEAVHQLDQALRTQPRFERQGFSNAFGFSYRYLAERLKLNASWAIEDCRVTDNDDQLRGFLAKSVADAEHILGNLSEAKKFYQICLKREHDPYVALMNIALILQQEGNTATYRDLIDYSSFPVTFDLMQEMNRKELGELNELIFESVVSHPSLTPEVHPESPTAKYITDTFIRANAPSPLPALVDMITEKIELLREKLTPRAGHPFYGSIPDRYRLELFGALLDPGGHHSPHVHTLCWLSGGYYARVPDLQSDIEDKAGFLEFGKLKRHTAIGFEGERHYVQPREGLLVMWPSYYMHNTIPCNDRRQRLTMGFNVIPLDKPISFELARA